MVKILAFDYGASSGRAILGLYDGENLRLKEVHRFTNDPVWVNGSYYWDILRLYHELKQGVLKCVLAGDTDLASLGIDSWGVDFGLLDSSGSLIGNPFHYRDARTEGMIEEACKLIPKEDIYRQTGIQFQKFNTLFQLLSLKRNNPELLEKASTMLFIPDLLNYFLTGVKASEFTIASTSQMLDPYTGGWAHDLLNKFGFPLDIFTPIIETGTIVGNLRQDVSTELGVGRIPVIAVAEHDTGSAVASVPAEGNKFAYLSCGTWSLLGVESSSPVINDATFQLNYTNEGGINKTTRLLKNIMGLWIYQECIRTWAKSGETFTFEELSEMAAIATPFESLIDPDDETFYRPMGMPDRIMDFCKNTGQKVPSDKGAILRCIMESLALKYRMAMEGLEQIVGYELPVLHMVGGGCQNKMLCQFTANAIKRPVMAGPIEATAIGNLICQLIAVGAVANIHEARALVKKSFPTTNYAPKDTEAWDEAYKKFSNLVTN